MKFGLHHSSWLESPDPAEAYEAVKAKAQWAEEHGFVWFSVMDHMIQTRSNRLFWISFVEGSCACGSSGAAVCGAGGVMAWERGRRRGG
jgi:hypothetical protein